MKLRFNILFIFLLLKESFLFSQNHFQLSGIITNEKSGEPLAGATVVIAEVKMAVSADSNGRYLIRNLNGGHYVMEISHVGFASISYHLELSGNQQKSFALKPEILENQGVVVTGVAGATNIRKTPIPISSIRKKMLLQTTATNIIDAMTQVPGVAQLSTGPAIAKPFIRGLGYNRVLILNDGVRQEGQQWGDEHGVEVDELSVNRAEILKGPASLVYGSDALAGVINFISNPTVPESVFRGNVISNYQSNNGLFAINGKLESNQNGISWNLSGTYKSAGNYKNRYDGYVLNSGFNERDFNGYLGINKRWGFSHFIFNRFDQRIGLVEGERDSATGKFILLGGSPLERIATQADLKSRNLFVPMQRVQHNKILSDNSFSLKRSRIKINLGFQNNIRQEFGNPEIPEEKSLVFDLNTFTYNLQWQLHEVKEWHTTIGINGMAQQNKNKGMETIVPAYRLFDFGGFVYLQKNFEKATLSGGVRFDNRALHADELWEGNVLKFSAFNRSFNNFSGSIGVSVEPSENLTLKFNLAKGFRSPGIAELASNGEHEGTNRYEYGNINLKPEVSLQGDAGVQLHTEHFSLNASLFYNRMRHFIFYSKLASVQGGDSLVMMNNEFIPAYIYLQQNARLYGGEAAIDLHPHPWDWLHFENSISLVRGVFDNPVDNSKNLPLIPAAKWSSELKAEFKKTGKVIRNGYLSLSMDNIFKQNHPFTGFATENITPRYTLWNFGMGADIVNNKKIHLFSVYLSVTNIANISYQSNLSRFKYMAVNNATGRTGVFNAGRNFSIKLNIPFNISTGKSKQR